MIAAIYARKSTDQNGVVEEAKSITRQVDHARTYAERKGWTVVDEHVYVDDGISGAEFAKRPAFVRLMSALTPTPPFQALIMSEESRLGREMVDTMGALKELVTAGVRVFYYLEDKERTLDSPIEKAIMALETFGAELERDKARQRTHDALVRKARAGHVTGGACFGYRNIEVLGPDGRRSHVVHEIDSTHAAVIRRIFELCAEGYGKKAIAKRLNAEGAASPRAQRGRIPAWSPSSVYEALHRERYRGSIVWNQTRKRDQWGQARRAKRPEAEVLRIDAPHLQIINDDLWEAAHARLSAARRVYLTGTRGRRFGRPPLGSPSPYLLTSFAQCGVCGSSLKVRTRSHRHFRAKFYGCSGYHDRGRTVCPNNADVPMVEADGMVLEVMLDELLTPDVLGAAVEAALQTLVGDQTHAGDHGDALDEQIRRVEQERDRLVQAVATGGELEGLLGALRDRETRLTGLRKECETVRAAARPVQHVDARRVREELHALASNWREVLSGEPGHARTILSRLLVGRVTFTPLEEPKRWELSGRGTLAGLFHTILPPGVASPRGHSLLWKPEIKGKARVAA